jgi:hypothetical protein
MEKIESHCEGPIDESPIVESNLEVDSVTLRRLLAEVRNEEAFEPGAYNRMHNRHNR